MKKTLIDPATLKNLGPLAKLTPDPSLANELKEGVITTLEYARILQSVDTDQVNETKDVTGLTNVFRDDKIDKSRMFTQAEALQNAKSQHDGYFVAEQALEQDL